MTIEWAVDTTFEHVVLWTLIGTYILLWMLVFWWIARRFTKWIDRKLYAFSDKEKM